MIKNAPVIIPVIYLIAALLIPLLRRRHERHAHSVALSAVFAAAFVSVHNLYYVLTSGTIHYHFAGWAPPVGIEYVLDPLSAFVLFVINSVSFFILVHASKVNAIEIHSKEIPYYSVVMLMLLGFNGIISTGDFFNLFVFLEISSLSVYGLIAMGERGSAFAAFRYLLLGTIGASFYLLGLAFLYMVSGSLNMADLREIIPLLNDSTVLVIGLTLMVTGVGIKMAVFPLHGWLPDAYTLASSSTSALVAAIGTKVSAYVMIRILFFVFGADYITETFPLASVLGWLGAAGIIYGSILAIAQKELKSMLAYSSIAQIGYITLGISMANALGFIGAVLHIINHAFMKGALFLVAANLRIRAGHSDISRLNRVCAKKMPWTMACFTVAALSMIGLPPVAGFFSKWYLVLGAVDNRQWIFLGVILLSSLLNAVYFFRIIENVYLKPSVSESDINECTLAEDEPGFSMIGPLVLFAVILLLLGIFNAYIVNNIIFLMMPPGL
jgi:multicomponent Na+:H+ antiporter subunit D